MPDAHDPITDCRRLRRRVIEAARQAGSGHCGSSLSCVEILWTLYRRILRYRPQEPGWSGRDRLILSKGHAAPILYAVLAESGFFDPALLSTLRRAGSSLQGHPDMCKTPGVDMSSGSLGMGISAGVGMALAGRLRGDDYRVFVVVGDGELQEGQNWEALAAAAKFALSRLVVIVDRNRLQIDGPVEEVMPMRDLAGKLIQFGLDVLECDGHDCAALERTLTEAPRGAGPTALIARTVKGKGVSFMENQAAWHGKPLSAEDHAQALRELEAA